MFNLELIRLADRTFYINAPTNIGVYKITDGEVMLIDSGNTAALAKRVQRLLSENGLKVRFIVNTHPHADHISGNAYFSNLYGCPVYAYKADRALVEYTQLSPIMTLGAHYSRELSGKFWIAPPTPAQELTQSVLPQGAELIELFGHSGFHIGFRTDSVIFLGDSVVGEKVIRESPVPYIFNIGQELKTLDKIKTLKADFFLPSHAEPVRDITSLVKMNENQIYKIINSIKRICKAPVCLDRLVKELFDEYKIKTDITQYTLVSSAVRSYISFMLDEGLLQWEAQDNMLLWKTAEG